MVNPYHQKMAEVLVAYSLQVQPGARVMIWTQLPGIPLAREVYRAVLGAGAHPVLRLTVGAVPMPILAYDGMTELKLREGSEDQLRFAATDVQDIEQFDALLGIMADEDTQALSDLPPERSALFQQSRGPVMHRFLERWGSDQLRWCFTLFPTTGYARDAGMTIEEYEAFVFRAGLMHRDDPVAAWREIATELQHRAQWLSGYDRFRVVAPGVDLSFRAGGRTWVDASGINNFPDGEVFTGPIEDSMQGEVHFTYPASYGGQTAEDVRLTFDRGRVVEATAARGQEFLTAMLDQDLGVRLVGEIAFGMNYGIERFTRNLLFDEKLGATMHLALGQGYPNTGSTNQSSLHWDLIWDMQAGRVYADDQLIYDHGRFISEAGKPVATAQT